MFRGIKFVLGRVICSIVGHRRVGAGYGWRTSTDNHHHSCWAYYCARCKAGHAEMMKLGAGNSLFDLWIVIPIIRAYNSIKEPHWEWRAGHCSSAAFPSLPRMLVAIAKGRKC